ncbi:hypothetical protein [Isoptericola sp. NPDC019482]|uniref:hypothetical protein n=1 Tax=Isoptericola sp. NPDC019482 TaxID=3154688 RepID=UPI003493E936
MTDTSRGPRWLRTRVGLAFVVALFTGLFAYLFAYAWTDEAVDGSPYAIADPVGTGVEGALAGLLPMLIGLGLCVPLLWNTGVAWRWPALLVVAGGSVGAVLGVATRFNEGMPAWAPAVLATVTLAAAVGLVADARSRIRAVSTPV